DAEEEGARGGAAVVAAGDAGEGEEGLVDEVVGVGAAAGGAADELEDRVVVPVVEDAQRAEVALAHPAQEVGIRPLVVQARRTALPAARRVRHGTGRGKFGGLLTGHGTEEGGDTRNGPDEQRGESREKPGVA